MLALESLLYLSKGSGVHRKTEKYTIPLPIDTENVVFLVRVPALTHDMFWQPSLVPCLLHQCYFGMSEDINNRPFNAHTIWMEQLYMFSRLSDHKDRSLDRSISFPPEPFCLDDVKWSSKHVRQWFVKIPLAQEQAFLTTTRYAKDIDPRVQRISLERTLTLKFPALAELVMNVPEDGMVCMKEPIHLDISIGQAGLATRIWQQDIW